MPTFTIYVTSGADWFYATLNAVAMIFSDSDLIWSVALMGAMFAIITGAWHFIQKNVGSGQIRTHTWVEHGLMMAIAVALGFAPTRCIVQDIYGDQTATAVDNVPLIVSVPAAIFSGISFEIFRAVDTSFQSTSGSYMSVSEQGFATPLKLLFAMRGGLEKSAPDLARSFQNYLLDCSKNSTINSRALATTPDLFRYLIENGRDTGLVETYIAPGAGGATQSLSTAAVVSCSQAKALLQQRFDVFESGAGAGQSDIERLINYNIQTAQKGGSGVNRYTYTDFENSFNQLLGFTGQSAQQYMRTALVRNLVNDTYRCANAAYDNAAFVNCTQIQNDAMEAYKIDSTGAASLFTKTMFPAMTLLQMMFFAFSVVIFLYGLLRGAGVLAYLGKYLLFGTWVFSWLPFVAVINAFIQWMVEEKIRQLPVAGLTSESYSAYMYDVLSTNLATASDMLAATPLLTLGLLTGSAFAMASVAGRLSARDYVDESQAAPRTGTVQPLVQTTAQHTSNVATGVQSADFTPYKFSASDATGETERSLWREAQDKSISQLRQFSRAHDTIVNHLSGQTFTNSEAVMNSLGVNRVQEVAESAGRDYAERIGAKSGAFERAEAVFKGDLGLSVPGVGGVGGGASSSDGHAMESSLDGEAKSILAAMRKSATNYANQNIASLTDVVQTLGGTTGTEVDRELNSYNESRAAAESASKAYENVVELRRSGATSIEFDSPALGKYFEDDAALGDKGNSWIRRIDERFSEVVQSHPSAAAAANHFRSTLTTHGKSYTPESDTLSKLMAIGRFDPTFKSGLLFEVAGQAPLSGSANMYSGVGSSAAGVTVENDIGGSVNPSSLPSATGIRTPQEVTQRLKELDSGNANVLAGAAAVQSSIEGKIDEMGGRGSTLTGSLDDAGANARTSVAAGTIKNIQDSNSLPPDVKHGLIEKADEAFVHGGVDRDNVIERVTQKNQEATGGWQSDGSFKVDFGGVNETNQQREFGNVAEPTPKEANYIPTKK
ncbi:conjugal transfer protein TraG N-terminal domain-containing protein [Allopusillimonas ginsengisoli]|uniref:conjugal transfer protein TraG N-terminal domain-containing protein n=1 Tax=Allopusillimonas ginsengisoli TaxID=453575 RepID=UPI0039C1B8F3